VLVGVAGHDLALTAVVDLALMVGVSAPTLVRQSPR
jgi:hypothetical protein